VLDTQGSELLILKGAEHTLGFIDVITTEVADFESYKDCARLEQIAGFLSSHGFREYCREELDRHPTGRWYYEITYVR
jgi:hypothetical protein